MKKNSRNSTWKLSPTMDNMWSSIEVFKEKKRKIFPEYDRNVYDEDILVKAPEVDEEKLDREAALTLQQIRRMSRFNQWSEDAVKVSSYSVSPPSSSSCRLPNPFVLRCLSRKFCLRIRLSSVFAALPLHQSPQHPHRLLLLDVKQLLLHVWRGRRRGRASPSSIGATTSLTR